MSEIRFYLGRHKIEILGRAKGKLLIRHLEEGYVGNKKEGYKKVSFPMGDIVMTRSCYKKRKKYLGKGDEDTE